MRDRPIRPADHPLTELLDAAISATRKPSSTDIAEAVTATARLHGITETQARDGLAATVANVAKCWGDDRNGEWVHSGEARQIAYDHVRSFIETHGTAPADDANADHRPMTDIIAGVPRS